MPNAIEWLNENALRSYPFKEDSSRADGNVTIPNRLIVDMSFLVPQGLTGEFYLKTLMMAGSQITGVIANEGGTNVGTFSIPVDSHATNDSYPITGAAAYEDARGRVVIGDITEIFTEIPEGIYEFEFDDATFEVSAVLPDLRRVRGIRVKRADTTVSDLITGIVQLTSGANIVLENPSPGVIRINAVGDEGYIDDCEDCDNKFVLPGPIRTINGVAGDENGNLDLVSLEPCLSITPNSEDSAVEFSDTCSQPCCGCTELEFLTTSLSTLRDSVAKLTATAEALQSNQSEFFQNVLSSL